MLINVKDLGQRLTQGKCKKGWLWLLFSHDDGSLNFWPGIWVLRMKAAFSSSHCRCGRLTKCWPLRYKGKHLVATSGIIDGYYPPCPFLHLAAENVDANHPGPRGEGHQSRATREKEPVSLPLNGTVPVLKRPPRLLSKREINICFI